MEQSNLRTNKLILKLVIIIFALLLGIGMMNHFIKTHFLWDTVIEGVDCTFFNLDEAIEKINLVKGKEIITFCFINGKTYNVPAEQLGIRCDEAQVVRIYNQQHLNPKASRKYELDGFILYDSKMLREFLKQIPELQKRNMIEPQNAYIVWDKTSFFIQEEVIGNIIDFEEALKIAQDKIKIDEKVIDFSPITYTTPEILAKDLVNERNELNSILNSLINFELSNGEIVTLDSEILKNWVYQDKEDNFKFDVEKGVPAFVEELAIRVNEANSYMQFTATNCKELATVNVPFAVRAQLDKEKQIAEIISLLGDPKSINTKPIYDRILISDILTSYIEIDISRQHIWFYLNGKVIVDTPCVTGCVADGHSTPTGIFFLLNKNKAVYLEGYNNDGSKYSSYVDYWMRFNRGIGMHDASWRTKFGGNIYMSGGSHGCVNMPKNAAAKTYEHIDDTMPIIVYKSEP